MAERAEKEAAAATARELETIARADRARATDAAPTTLSLRSHHKIGSGSKWSGHEAFLHGSVFSMAYLRREEFDPVLAKRSWTRLKVS